MQHRAIGMVLLAMLYASLSTPAYAYLDAATGSIILQAVIGAVATSMLFARLYIAKIKAFFSRSGPVDTVRTPDAE
jgi:hypothetical protein